MEWFSPIFRQGSKLCDGISCIWRFHQTLQSVQHLMQMTFHCLFKLTHGPLCGKIQVLVQVLFDEKHKSQNTPNDSTISSLQWVPTLFCVDLNLFLHPGLAEAIFLLGTPSLVRPQQPVWTLLEFGQAMLQLLDLSLGIDLRALFRVVLFFLQAGLGREEYPGSCKGETFQDNSNIPLELKMLKESFFIFVPLGT